MRVCFTSDFHGRLGHYDQLTHLLRAARPAVVVLGGDMHAEVDARDPLGTQAAFVERRLGPLIDDWRAAAPRLEVLSILGNHDMGCVLPAMQALEQSGRLTLLDHHRYRPLGGLYWLGVSLTPPTPYWVKDLERLDWPDDPLPELGGFVWDALTQTSRDVTAAAHFRRWPSLAEELAAAPAAPGPWILVCHAPPYDTRLDRVADGGRAAGSRAVRTFIEQRSPLCALHGHVHESPEVGGAYVQRIGATPCVNPGQSADRLYAVLFETEDIEGTLRHTVFG